MSEELKAQHNIPSDLEQLPVIWRYELLRYLRSWRLYASIVIVVAVMALLYLLPPLLGEGYSGTDTETLLWVTPTGGLPDDPVPVYAVGMINRSQIDTASLTLYRDGAEYASAGGTVWSLTEVEYGSATVYTIVFLEDVTGSEITATYDWYISPESFETLFLNFASFLIIICATFFGADAIVGEFQNRTGYLVFPNPMRRSVLFAGKFMASITAGLMVVVFFYAVLAGLSLVSARGLDDDLLLSFLYAVEFLLAAMAVAYLVSSLLKGTTGATVLTFFLFIMILPIVDSVSMFSGVKLEGSVTFSAGAMIYVLTDPYPADEVQDYGAFRMTMFYPDPALAHVVMLGYALAATALGIWLFNRKQLAG
ncbi:MAG: ABC transporter permease [Candidatus Thermoplasmatota archaeon]